jgi:hypothetical protein
MLHLQSPWTRLKNESQPNNVSINLTLNIILANCWPFLDEGKKQKSEHIDKYIRHSCKEEPSQHQLSSCIQYIHTHKED